jgi:tetratricopeptide (TPR) repeat protein
MKIYAKQVPPEYQESPLFLGDEFWPAGIILDGNRDYNSHTTDLYDRIIQCYDEAAREIENLDLKNGYAAYGNATEAINDYFPALEYREKPYNTRDIHRIREALRMYGTTDYYNGRYVTAMLDAITGGDWRNGTIRGCCQGDWQHVIYDANRWSRAELDVFETEYFNTGSEWIVHDENTEPDGPEDISGFSVYCHGWRTEDIKMEIAEAYGATDAEVILYQHTGYTRI